MGGAENVVLAMHEAFPDAPIYTAIYNDKNMPAFRELDVRTSHLHRLPKQLRKYHKLFPTLATKAISKLDLSAYDVILTSTYLVGHHVTKSRPDQIVIAYCHTPPRYYWSHYDEYRRNPGFGKLNPIVRSLMPLMVPKQRRLDIAAAKNVDVYIANSTETQKRIKKYYGRSSTVVYPPVDIQRFTPQQTRAEHYVTSGRQLPYKRHDLAVAAATKLSKKLYVFGDGPMHKQLVSIAGPTIEFRTDRYGDASDGELERLLTTARGYIFPTEEDFGIVTVEALAAGAPVVGLARGGTTDIITSEELGVLFERQTVDDVVEAIQLLESRTYSPSKLSRTAKRFAKTLFIQKIRKIVADNS